MAEAYFTTELFRFLDELKAHNERAWFEANKARFETAVRGPALSLIGDLGPRLAKISREIVADARPVGGSLMRIHRDIRFSRDKTPYKTDIGFFFRHRAGKDAVAPGLYLSLQPGGSMAGGGVWQPAPPALQRIRDAIVAHPRKWQKLIAELRAAPGGLSFHGETLKRPPQGFDAAHPCIEDLKRKSFAVGVGLSDEVVTSARFMDLLLERYRIMLPFLRFLAEALGSRF
jgi:uncharacterized protein (TIGR02453 family)